MDEVITELEIEKGRLEREIDEARAVRADLAAQLRALWDEMEEPGSSAVPLAAAEAMALELCDSRACVPLMRTTLAAGETMRLGRRALIDTLREDVERISAEMGIGPGDEEWLDIALLCSSGGIRRSVVDALQHQAEALREAMQERLAACEAHLRTIRLVDAVEGVAPRAGDPPAVLSVRAENRQRRLRS